MKKNIITIVVLIIILALIGTLCYGYYKKFTFKPQNPVATMEVEGFGTMKIELYPDEAPNTVANFIALANRGFYDGLTFHRTIPDFMIQGGDKEENGTGTPKLSDLKDGGSDEKYSIKGEFLANGYTKNTLKHEKGVISMARSDYSAYASMDPELVEKGYNSAGSQFFIMTKDNTSLNGSYAPFGKVTEGLDVLDKIANVEVVTRDENAQEGLDKPVNPPVIKSLKVDTFGIDYGEPETEKAFDMNEWMQQLYGGATTTTGTTEE